MKIPTITIPEALERYQEVATIPEMLQAIATHGRLEALKENKWVREYVELIDSHDRAVNVLEERVEALVSDE